jgi:hypothetical protein
MERGAVRAEDKESRNCQPGGKSNVEAGWEKGKAHIELHNFVNYP